MTEGKGDAGSSSGGTTKASSTPNVKGADAGDEFIDFGGTQGKYALLMVPDYDVATEKNQASYASYGASSLPSGTGYSAWALFRGLTKGIRVHTDGELVTTTREDRLEVVGGNYELHVRGDAEPGAYDAALAPPTTPPTVPALSNATTFRNDDQVYLRLGLHDGTPHLPDFLDADDSKKSEIGDIITDLTRATTLGVKQFAWEDHAGGHRITTTKGDKVEIIAGKSYVHVLGADDFDVSEGQKSIARTGSDPQMSGYTSADNDKKRPMMVERTWARRSISETWLGVNRTKPDSQLKADAEIQLTSFPEVKDGEAREYTYADKLSSFTGDADNWVDDMVETTYVKRVDNKTHAEKIDEMTKVKGAITETTLVPFMTSTQISVLLTETYLGGHVALEVGAGVEMKFGKYLEIFGGTKTELEVATSTEWMAGQVRYFAFKKEDTTLEDLKVSLQTKTVALKDENVALKASITALESKITAAKVNIGTP